MEPLRPHPRPPAKATPDLLLVTVPTYLLNVLFLAWSFRALLSPASLVFWVALSFLVGLGWIAFSRVQPSPPLVESAFGLALATTYTWFLYFAFPHANAADQLVLAAITVVVLTLGTVTLATRPVAAFTWLGAFFAGLLVTLISDGRWVEPVDLAFLISLAVVLVLLVLNFSQRERQRLRSEGEAAQQKQVVELLLHNFEEGTMDWLWETDASGVLRGVSSRLAEQWNRSAESLEGQSLIGALVVDPTNLTVEEEEEVATLQNLLQSRQPFSDTEVPAQVGDQHRRWKLSAKPILSKEGVLVGWRGVGSDVTEMQRLNNLNARLALLDNLTGLANRNRLMAVLHDHLSPRAGQRPCCLILLDIEGFRVINEGLSHEVGDVLLKEVAHRLRSRVPASTLLARLGGDEFALIAPGAGDEAQDGLVAALLSTNDDPYTIDGNRIELTFQLGIALFPRDANSAHELLKCAELALHDSKTTRQGHPTVYRSEMGQRAKDRIRLQAELKTALVEGQFELHYQPQIHLFDGEVAGAEALVRWRHPSRGMVSPAEFIPALEETGLIVPVGMIILEAACREALTWPRRERVAVNVSAVQFASRTFLESVSGILVATGLPAERLELEITESVMAQDPKQVVLILKELRALGISVALDDFGTGYSSLSYLRQLPLDKLKVDQSFVRVLGQDPNAEAIVRTVLNLARTLGLATTAEGVETTAQRDFLAQLGVNTVQGYLYSKPLPAKDLLSFREGLIDLLGRH